MKFAAVLLSRGNPDALVGVLMGLWRLRSEQHEITFFVGTDNDDDATDRALCAIREIPRENLFQSIQPRPVTRGQIENMLLKLTEEDHEVVTLMTDRTFCITPGWDDALARGLKEKPNRLLWWSCPQDNMCVIPIIPRAYLDACDYVWSPEIFPFWFDDTWNQQIDLLIHGMPSLKSKAAYSGLRTYTQRGRDFAFWAEVFNETLPLRIEKAKEMAPKLGVSWQERRDVLLYIENVSKGLIENVEKYQKLFGDPRDPGPEYITAKSRAEKMLADMRAIRAEIGEAA